MENPLVGVMLVGESSTVGSHLGLVHLPENSRAETISNFRSVLSSLDHLKAISFSFLTPHGWEISKQMEDKVTIRDVISLEGVIKVRIAYPKPKYGVTIEGTNDSPLPVGFLFCASDTSIVLLKDEIREQLPVLYRFLSTTRFAFLDLNGWPISRQQEAKVTVLEVACHNVIRITCAKQSTQSLDDNQPIVGEPNNVASNNQLDITPGILPESVDCLDTSLVQTFTDPDINFLNKSSASSFCEILISYVHTEASSYALLLKASLQEHGYNVFLDVHSIQGGTDWQDALNDAISNCSLFVPLITSQYGQTLWTNREVKLADVLGKVIIPVNFLSSWPPKCLAIQFATTQFVAAYKNQSIPDIPDEKVVAEVASDISSRYSLEKTATLNQSLEEPTDEAEAFSSSLSRQDTQIIREDSLSRNSGSSSSLRSPGSPLLIRKRSTVRSYASTLPRTVDASFRESIMKSRDGKPFIVICCAPQQQEFSHSLMNDVSLKEYEVWCSCDIDTSSDEVDSAQLIFQQKVDEAGVVIFVLSEEFAESSFCEQQVYYCEQRKRIIPLIYKPMQLPSWMAMLIGTSTFISCQAHSYKSTLLERISKLLSPRNVEEELKQIQKQKVELANLCSKLSEQLPPGKHVYISGGTQFYSSSGKAICEALGQALAKDDDIVLVTGGFYGVGETVSKAFFDERIRLNKIHGVCHVVAVRDKEDKSNQTRQNPDGTFPRVPFGDTLFFGESVRDREMLTPRVIDLCILIEGGPGAAFEAQQFTWNGNRVIPVKVTGGAAGGLFNMPSSIFVKPLTVEENDWAMLTNSSVAPKDVASAVFDIIQALKNPSAISRKRCHSESDNKMKKRVSIKRSETLPLEES